MQPGESGANCTLKQLVLEKLAGRSIGLSVTAIAFVQRPRGPAGKELLDRSREGDKRSSLCVDLMAVDTDRFSYEPRKRRVRPRHYDVNRVRD